MTVVNAYDGAELIWSESTSHAVTQILLNQNANVLMLSRAAVISVKLIWSSRHGTPLLKITGIHPLRLAIRMWWPWRPSAALSHTTIHRGFTVVL